MWGHFPNLTDHDRCSPKLRLDHCRHVPSSALSSHKAEKRLRKHCSSSHLQGFLTKPGLAQSSSNAAWRMSALLVKMILHYQFFKKRKKDGKRCKNPGRSPLLLLWNRWDGKAAASWLWNFISKPETNVQISEQNQYNSRRGNHSIWKTIWILHSQSCNPCARGAFCSDITIPRPQSLFRGRH